MAAAQNCITPFLHTLQMVLFALALFTVNTQARIGYFWHITDLHLDTFYSTQGDVMHGCWRIDGQSPSSSIRSPGRFGDYFCDSPWSLIDSAAKAMKTRQGDNVEFVLWTGDGLSHSALKESDTKRLEILRNITDLLGRTFSSQFVFPVLGHEDGTTNFRHMGELWRHWLPSEALHTFEKGGYYSIEQTKSRLRIIALNTNFMRHDHKSAPPSHLAAVRQRTPNGFGANGGGGDSDYKTYYYHHGSMHQHHGHSPNDWLAHTGGGSYYGVGGGGYGIGHHRGMNTIPALSVGGVSVGGGGGGGIDGGGRVSALSEYETQDAEKQWVWLEEVLFKSKNNKETVYIVGHIPPGSDERHIGLQQNGHTTFTENNNKRYLELVRKYSSIIQGQFFGHLHSDSFRIIYDDDGKPVSWMMISPSVTPRKLNVGSNNPAMRLYKFDTDSGQVLDYTQYFMDLQLANQVGEPNWLPEYNLTHYYALSDISAISLHNFVDRFTSGDGSWFSKYVRANTVRYQTDVCANVCMLNHYCAITCVDYKEFRQCLEKEQSALRSRAPAAHTQLAGACPILVLLCALLVSTIHQASVLLPKFIARMRVQQQQQQRQQKQQHQQMHRLQQETKAKEQQQQNPRLQQQFIGGSSKKEWKIELVVKARATITKPSTTTTRKTTIMTITKPTAAAAVEGAKNEVALTSVSLFKAPTFACVLLLRVLLLLLLQLHCITLKRRRQQTTKACHRFCCCSCATLTNRNVQYYQLGKERGREGKGGAGVNTKVAASEMEYFYMQQRSSTQQQQQQRQYAGNMHAMLRRQLDSGMVLLQRPVALLSNCYGSSLFSFCSYNIVAASTTTKTTAPTMVMVDVNNTSDKNSVPPQWRQQQQKQQLLWHDENQNYADNKNAQSHAIAKFSIVQLQQLPQDNNSNSNNVNYAALRFAEALCPHCHISVLCGVNCNGLWLKSSKHPKKPHSQGTHCETCGACTANATVAADTFSIINNNYLNSFANPKKQQLHRRVCISFGYD